MQQRFLLQILLLAQHVSGTTMPIMRSSRVLYSGCCLWYFVLWFSSCWSGVELRVMCPICRMLQHPANRTHNPQLVSILYVFPHINHLTPNGHYMGRTAQLTSRCCILYIYSTNIRSEYFKHAA